MSSSITEFSVLTVYVIVFGIMQSLLPSWLGGELYLM